MIIGAIIAVWQYVLTSRSERAKISNDRVEKAINLAEYYKDNILPKVAALRYVFEESGIKSILDKIKPSDMIDFDSDELNEKLSSADINAITDKMKSKEMVKTIFFVDTAYNLNLGLDEFINVKKSDGEKKEIFVDKDGILKKFMSNVVNDLLNNMEYFSMNFTHKVADESVVFQSLHQTYIEAVQFLYYNISINNRPDGRQFYTNVVELYEIWYNKQKEKRKYVVENGRKISKGSTAKDID